MPQEITDASHFSGRTTWNRTHADGSNHWNDSEAGLDAGASSQAGHSYTRGAPGTHDRTGLDRIGDDNLWQNSLREIKRKPPKSIKRFFSSLILLLFL